MLYMVHALCGSMAKLYCIQCVDDWYKVFLSGRGPAVHVAASTGGLWSGQWVLRWTAVTPVPCR